MSSAKFKEYFGVAAIFGLSATLIGTSYAATDSVSETSQLASPDKVVRADDVVGGVPPSLQEDLDEVCRVVQELVNEAQRRAPAPQIEVAPQQDFGADF